MDTCIIRSLLCDTIVANSQAFEWNIRSVMGMRGEKGKEEKGKGQGAEGEYESKNKRNLWQEILTEQATQDIYVIEAIKLLYELLPYSSKNATILHRNNE